MFGTCQVRGEFSTPVWCLALCVAAGCSVDPLRPETEAFSSPSAITTAGGARIALQQHLTSDAGPTVLVKLDFASGSVTPPEPLTGPRGIPALAGDDTRAYLTWTDHDHSVGAALAADGSLGPTFDFCSDCSTRPFIVADRVLVVESRWARQDARWIEADGSVGAPFPFPGDVAQIGHRNNVAGSSAGGDLGATLAKRAFDTFVVARTDGYELVLDDAKQMGSIAALADGSLLVSYATNNDVWLIRIERDGTVSSRRDDAPCMPELVVAQDRIFGVCGRWVDGRLAVHAYQLDASGTFLDSGTLMHDSQSSYTDIDDIPVAGVGRDLLVFDLSSWPAVTHYDGMAHPPVIVAGGPDA